MKQNNSNKEIIDTKEKTEDMKCITEETREERRARLKEQLDKAVKHSNMSLAEAIATYNYLNKEGEYYLRVIRTSGKPKFISQRYESVEWKKGLENTPKIQ